MEINVNVTSTITIKDILQSYDANDLLRTIPNDYKLNPLVLKAYAKRSKPSLSLQISLTTQIYDWLSTISKNANAPFALVFNFLIENVANCGKVHTKNIKQALDCYYYAVAHDHALLSRILNEYADSEFYKDEEECIRENENEEEDKKDDNWGLSEEGVAYFLAITESGQEIVNAYKNKIKK